MTLMRATSCQEEGALAAWCFYLKLYLIYVPASEQALLGNNRFDLLILLFTKAIVEMSKRRVSRLPLIRIVVLLFLYFFFRSSGVGRPFRPLYKGRCILGLPCMTGYSSCEWLSWFSVIDHMHTCISHAYVLFRYQYFADSPRTYLTLFPPLQNQIPSKRRACAPFSPIRSFQHGASWSMPKSESFATWQPSWQASWLSKPHRYLLVPVSTGIQCLTSGDDRFLLL